MNISNLIAAFFILSCSSLYGSDSLIFPEKPTLGQYVVDRANILTPAEKRELSKILGNLIKSQTEPVLVVLIKRKSDFGAFELSLQQYTDELVEQWWPFFPNAPDAENAVGLFTSYRETDPNFWYYRGTMVLVSLQEKEVAVHVGCSYTTTTQNRRKERLRRYIKAYMLQADGNLALGLKYAALSIRNARLTLPAPPMPKDEYRTHKIAIILLLFGCMFYSVIFNKETSLVCYCLGYIFWAIAGLVASAAIHNEVKKQRNEEWLSESFGIGALGNQLLEHALAADVFTDESNGQMGFSATKHSH